MKSSCFAPHWPTLSSGCHLSAAEPERAATGHAFQSSQEVVVTSKVQSSQEGQRHHHGSGRRRQAARSFNRRAGLLSQRCTVATVAVSAAEGTSAVCSVRIRGRGIEGWTHVYSKFTAHCAAPTVASQLLSPTHDRPSRTSAHSLTSCQPPRPVDAAAGPAAGFTSTLEVLDTLDDLLRLEPREAEPHVALTLQ